MPDRIRLDGRVAVVTGAAGVIGTATIKLLAERGARIVAVDRKRADLEAAIGDLPASAQAVAVAGDLTSEDEVKDYVGVALSKFGTIDVFYNNAGVEGEVKPITDYTLEAFRRVIDVNVIGVFLGLKHVLPVMLKQNKGSIINTASIAAFEGQIGQVAYTASKAAIAGMCLTMARDMGSLGIRALAIAPSLFATGLTEGIPDEFAKALTKDAAFPKRLGRPEEYAKLVQAIVENPMLNGQCLRLDAGQRFAPK